MNKLDGKSLCLIPARGGSKRIPRKNIKEFLGRPIITYSIETAISSNLFDTVMVTTDDDEIAKLAETFGAEIPFKRTGDTADDHATTLDVVKEVLQAYEKRGNHFESICILYPTAPFVTVQKLQEAAELLRNYDAVVPVSKFSFPVWRAFKKEEGYIKYQWPQYEKLRSQDLTPLYHDAGQWYFIRVCEIKETLIPRNTASVELSNLEVQDIDSLDDWRIAELKYEYLQRTK